MKLFSQTGFGSWTVVCPFLLLCIQFDTYRTQNLFKTRQVISYKSIVFFSPLGPLKLLFRPQAAHWQLGAGLGQKEPARGGRQAGGKARAQAGRQQGGRYTLPTRPRCSQSSPKWPVLAPASASPRLVLASSQPGGRRRGKVWGSQSDGVSQPRPVSWWSDPTSPHPAPLQVSRGTCWIGAPEVFPRLRSC